MTAVHKEYARWTPAMEAKAAELRAMGWTFAAIGEELGVSYQSVINHIGAAAMRKKNSARSAGRFAVGDRVVYRANEYGNSDIDGWEGVVIFVDGTACPYTVRFDEAWLGGMSEERLGNRERNSMRCWFCREENLSLVGEAKKR
ncbi:MAG: hypothetical protein IIX15_04910 [Clostridia bacterium]|nr:hypothetical protein [Clostridia bacterium]